MYATEYTINKIILSWWKAYVWTNNPAGISNKTAQQKWTPSNCILKYNDAAAFLAM